MIAVVVGWLTGFAVDGGGQAQALHDWRVFPVTLTGRRSPCDCADCTDRRAA